MGTKQLHPYIREYQQMRKAFIRANNGMKPTKNKNWWKAYYKKFYGKARKQYGNI